MDTVRSLLQQAVDITTAISVAEWSAILLAVLVIQAGLILRRLNRKSDRVMLEQFAEVNTRLNMLIFETRRAAAANKPEEGVFTSEQYDVAAE